MNSLNSMRFVWACGTMAGMLAVAGCGRQETAAPTPAAASAPLVRGIASEGAASRTADKTDSTSAGGVANLAEPPSMNNPASSPSPVGAASQSVSATTLGTSPKPDDGTSASPGQGSTNTRGGPGTR